MRTVVVNLHHGDRYDVYIGRGRGGIWGNPFSHLPGTLAQFKVDTKEEALQRHREWFLEQKHLLDKLHILKGKRLGCFCKPGRCHGDLYVELLDQEDNNGIDQH